MFPYQFVGNAVADFHIHALRAAEQTRADDIKFEVALFVRGERRVSFQRGGSGITRSKIIGKRAQSPGSKRFFTVGISRHEARHRQRAVYVRNQLVFRENGIVDRRFAHFVFRHVEHGRCRPVAVKRKIRKVEPDLIGIIGFQLHKAFHIHAVYEMAVEIRLVFRSEADGNGNRRFAVSLQIEFAAVERRSPLLHRAGVALFGVFEQIRLFRNRLVIARHAFRHHDGVDVIAERVA